MLRVQVAGYRGGLVGLGLEPGDRVAIACANNWYFVSVLPGHPGRRDWWRYRSTPRARRANCSVSWPRSAPGRWWWARRPAKPSPRSTRADIPTRRPRVVLQLRRAHGERRHGRHVELDALLAAAPVPVWSASDDDLAVLMFTSGTAGTPQSSDAEPRQPAGEPGLTSARPSEGGGVDRADRRGPRRPAPASHLRAQRGVGGHLARGCVDRADRAVRPGVRGRVHRTMGGHDRGRPAEPLGVAGRADRRAACPVRDRAHRPFGRGRAARRTCATSVASRLGLQLREGYGLTESAPSVASTAGMQTGPDRWGRPTPTSRCGWSMPTARTWSPAIRARSGCAAPRCSRATGTIRRRPQRR